VMTVLEPTLSGPAPGTNLPPAHRWHRRAVFIITAFFGTMFCAFVLSTVLAGSANAAPLGVPSLPVPALALPVTPASTSATLVSPTEKSALSPVGKIPITSATSPEPTVTSVAASALTRVNRTVGPLVHQVVGTVNESIPAVPPTTTSAPGRAPTARANTIGVGEPPRVDSESPASRGLPPAAKASNNQTGLVEASFRATPMSLDSLPSIPPSFPFRSPTFPSRNLPVTPGIPSEGLLSGHGSSQFGSLPSMGLLLPVSLSGIASVGREKVPALLLDMRHSPPG
jgi:hypothetical protein